jgi:uncharacterized protein (TIGR03437 family)
MKPLATVVAVLACALTSPARPSDPRALLSTLPLSFEPGANGYIAAGPSYRLTVTPSGLEFNWNSGRTRALRMQLSGSNRHATLEGADRQPASANYFLGSNPAAWRTGVPRYSQVRLHDAYPGVDLLVYGSGKTIEFDFDLAPGADPRRIHMDFTGATGERVEDGALVLPTPAGEVRWSRPVAYQTVDGQRRPVAGRFVTEGRNRAGFELGTYDRSQALVIDPVVNFSTYFGGSNNEAARGVAVDSSGNIFIAGVTTTRNLPVSSNAAQPAYGGESMSYQTGDAFVAKFTPSGMLAAMTYLGGSADDLASSLAVDSAGNVYVTGYTNSHDFPVSANPYQNHLVGAGGNLLFTVGDAFIVKLNSSLSKIMYSTFLGGTNDEAATAIAVDAAGNAYITGITLSQNFPVTSGAAQKFFHGSGGQPITDFGVPFFITGDAFVSKLSADGSQLVFSTYLGGSADDAATSIAVDSAGNVYVAGFTISSDFPTTANAAQTVYKGEEPTNAFYNLGDGFVTKLNPAGTAILYSTYLGGSGDDAVAAIAVDAAGSVYATGATTSQNFPVTSGAFQMTNAGPTSDSGASERVVGDVFVTKLKPDGSGFVFSTFLGGQGDDAGHGIAVDSAGNVFVGGSTASSNFPLTSDATQSRYGGAGGEHNNNDLYGDGFLTVLNPTGTKLVFSTFLGGGMDDSIEGLALDPAGNAYVAGVTMSPNFPASSGAYQAKYGGGGSLSAGRIYGDAFLARISAPTLGALALSVSPARLNFSYNVGAAKPPAATLALSAPTSVPYIVSPLPENWLTVTPNTGQTAANLTVTVDPTGLAANTYTATITITTSAPGIASVSIPVTLTVSGAPGGPVLTAAGIVNAASGVGGAIAPGEMVVIYGLNMGPSALVPLQLNSAGMVANSLAGTQVLFNNVAAPLIYTSAGQVSAVVPYEVAGQTNVPVQVTYNGNASAAVSVPVAAAAPALFTINQQGTGQAAALNQDYTLNGPGNPAARGSVIQLFGTGEGSIQPAVADGTLANSAPFPTPSLQISATIDGQPAQVQYGGTAPGGVAGFLQVNLIVPANARSGIVPVVITVGNASSPSTATIAVQ